MPRLEVVLDPPAPTVAVRQPIRGHVEVDAEKGGRCDGLTVRAQWHTHGRGTVVTGGGEARELFRGEWAPGERARYPFELPGVEGPLTYHGTEVNLDWRVLATADVPWAIDPKAEAELVLVRGDARPLEVQQVLVPQVDAVAATQKALPCIAFFLVTFFLLPGLGISAFGAVRTLQGDPAGFMMVPFGLVFGGIAAFMLALVLRRSIAARKLGEVEVRVTPETVRPGEALRVDVAFRPKGGVRLNGVTAELVGRESASRGSGTNRRTFTHDLFREKVELRGRGEVRRLEDVSAEATLRVPEGAAPSLAVSDNEVRWSLAVHIDIEGWPDWESDQPITVLPA